MDEVGAAASCSDHATVTMLQGLCYKHNKTDLTFDIASVATEAAFLTCNLSCSWHCVLVHDSHALHIVSLCPTIMQIVI